MDLSITNETLNRSFNISNGTIAGWKDEDWNTLNTNSLGETLNDSLNTTALWEETSGSGYLKNDRPFKFSLLKMAELGHGAYSPEKYV